MGLSKIITVVIILFSIGGPLPVVSSKLTACEVIDDRENRRSESENFLRLRSFFEFVDLQSKYNTLLLRKNYSFYVGSKDNCFLVSIHITHNDTSGGLYTLILMGNHLLII